ncbi:efflux RND transporter periplasmic adaptor subunit [Domibacillus sp. PGB-M46]|uniref:efflux RND transporter periplasmic adaptor subunit n=1 Tax=Domibacillus sp. PGB-M46 TaxID=2910255 RepID=UPI001F5778CA|nr:efflux RND transporter periplasmic adaptor subunit [Domibacillus sp. PGB-M46]MCI2253044.1 efflux RND transporter periplasmic adaptor subunit [Domibacillus sp. PGB-M46]
MKKIKKQVWLAASAVVIAGNLYLIFKEDSRAVRSEWLTDWDRSETGDVVESFSAEGVVVPSDEYPIYFDESKGSLEEVFVKEGEAIQPGTPLFQYSPDVIEDEIARLTAEKDQTQQQISLIDNQLSQLRLLLSEAENEENETANTDDSSDSDSDGDTTIVQSGDASTGVEESILQQETEKQKLQEEVKKYDTLIAAQEAKKDNLTVKSTNEGYVKKIDTSLNNPVMIINSSVPAVKGVFDEKQMAKSAPDQRVEVTVDTTLEQFSGSLSSVSTYPEEEPSVKRASLYPYSAQLSGAASSDLYPGLKASVKVITDEQPDVVTIPNTAILRKNQKSYAIVLNQEGLLERRRIETGLHVDGVYQVTKGVEDGEAIVIDPYRLVMKHGPFITPIDTDHIKKKPWNELSRTEKIKYALMGFLS